MNNMNGKKAHKFSGKLKLETVLQNVGDDSKVVTLRLFDEAGTLNSLHEMPINKMLIVTHGGRPADRLGITLRREVLLVKDCGGHASLSTTAGLFYETKSMGW